jgi:putative transposase
MDFVSDALFNGKRFREPTVVDAFTRECLAIHADQGIKGEQVVDVMDRLLFQRGTAPAKIRVDNGPEFISRALGQWAYQNQITLEFSRPGKPTDNAFVESFNGRRRDECLNTHWFLSLDDARAKLEAWRRDFNETRPHTSLAFMPPAEFTSSAGVNPGRWSARYLILAGYKTGTWSQSEGLCFWTVPIWGARRRFEPCLPKSHLTCSVNWI